MKRFWLGMAVFLFSVASAQSAEMDVFKDAADGAKVHAVSGFVCPKEVGRFDRDAVGENDPAADADYCAYSARDGVYGTVILMPLHGDFDPKAILARDFGVLEGNGGKLVSESTMSFGPHQELAIYARIYNATKIEAMRYRTLFACSAVSNWVIRVTVEYASPRDEDVKNAFITDVYAAALQRLGGQ